VCILNNITPNIEQLIDTVIMPAYIQYSGVQSYINTLEDTVKSLNDEVSKLRTALNEAQIRLSELEQGESKDHALLLTQYP
jgi:flagellar biosynthesis chaperone FliJ